MAFVLNFLLFGLSVAASRDLCTLTGVFSQDVANTAMKTCTSLAIDTLQVPAGVTCDLTKLLPGTHLTFAGNTTFGFKVAYFFRYPLILFSYLVLDWAAIQDQGGSANHSWFGQFRD